jgi:23S rRNA pseudouridine1911/1915/1917 synthase
MDMKIIYEDENLLAINKPAGIETVQMIEILSKERLGLEKIHRLDKDTSGVNLIAKNPEALIFFQKQFINREVRKKYLALVIGNIKDDQGRIETLIGRGLKDKRKQRAYLFNEPGSLKGKREAITEYKVLTRFKDFTLLEVFPKTGRMHQIRCHLAYINHPIAGDKKYGFKNQPKPKDLNRQFLHASYIDIKLFNGETKELSSELAQDLKICLENLKKNCPI